jgi:hypothetical protein
MKTKFFICECKCGVIHLDYDPDWGLEIAMFERSVARSWWNRIRQAWSALRGKPYTDMIILNEQQIADLVDYLFEVQNRDYATKKSIYAVVEKLHEYDSKEVIDALVDYVKLLPRSTHKQKLLSELKPLQY